MGDLALLLQNLELARAAGRVSMVRYWNPVPPSTIAQIIAAGGKMASGRDTRSFLRLAYTSDVVIGGGQMIRANIGRKALLTLLMTVLAARSGHGLVTTRGLGVARITGKSQRIIWRTILQCADRVRVRDIQSRDAARYLMGPAGKIDLTADMAFYLTPLHERLNATPDLRRHIIIAPCTEKSENRSFGGPRLAAVVDALRRQVNGNSLSFVPHDTASGMDMPVCERLSDEFSDLDSGVFASNILETVLDHYGQSSAILTNRLHAAIFGVLSGRPVIVADDGTGKLLALAKMFDLTVIDLRKPATVQLPDDWAKMALRVDHEARRSKIAALSHLARENVQA